MLMILSALLMFCWSGTPTEAVSEDLGITISAADGQKLSGHLSHGNREIGAGVVLLPMYRQTKESWEPLLKALKTRGFTSLALDLRGHGGSRYAPGGSDLSLRVASRDPELFNKMHLDAEAGVRYLLDHGLKPDRIALVGASVGCSVALDTITRGKVPVRATVIMTPGENYLGIPTMSQISRWPGIPLLILSSEEELARGAGSIHRQLRNRGAELRTFPEENIHGTGMFGEVDGVEELIANWLSGQLR